MKTFCIYMIVSLFLYTVGISQVEDTTKIRLGNKKVMIVNEGEDVEVVDDKDTDTDSEEDDNAGDNEDTLSCKKKHKRKADMHWGGIEIGLNSYLNRNYSTVLPMQADFLELNTNKSWAVGINFGEISIPVCSRFLFIGSGLGFEFNNYRFDKNITLVPDSQEITYYIDTLHTYKINKLTATYLRVPLLLEFQIPVNKKNKKLFVSAGVIGAIKLGSHTKQVIEGSDESHKVKKDFHLSPFRYGATARVGFENISVFSTCYLSPLFEEQEGPELYPYTVGICFTF